MIDYITLHFFQHFIFLYLNNESCNILYAVIIKRNDYETISVSEVKKQITLLRTQYSRLLKPKPSGSGDATATAKQIWLLKNMEFLKKHMMPRHTETSVSIPLFFSIRTLFVE